MVKKPIWEEVPTLLLFFLFEALKCPFSKFGAICIQSCYHYIIISSIPFSHSGQCSMTQRHAGV